LKCEIELFYSVQSFTEHMIRSEHAESFFETTHAGAGVSLGGVFDASMNRELGTAKGVTRNFQDLISQSSTITQKVTIKKKSHNCSRIVAATAICGPYEIVTKEYGCDSGALTL
jgi:hypothetical protein